MNADYVRIQLHNLLRRELDDCERSLLQNDVIKAKRELESAISKIKRLIPHLS